MVHNRSTKVAGLVLNARSIGETDRQIILLTQSMGKVVAVAKGVRKSSSTTGGTMQPGNLIEGLLIQTKSWPIITQAKLVDDTSQIRTNLKKIKQLLQILEMIDALFVEEELSRSQYELVLALRQAVVGTQTRQQIINLLLELIESLGFPRPDLNQTTLSKYLEELVGKKMKSFKYLTV